MKKYYSKLLLFGEFTIIKGSSGLAVPYQKYSGQWIFTEESNDSNKALSKWYEYLKEQKIPADLSINLDLKQFKEDIGNGLTFESNIPLGYGVGSSGALSVAFLEKYVTIIHIDKNDIFRLKTIFIWLEGFFHGGGSGVDPLICYYQQPLLIKPNHKFELTTLPIFKENSNQTCFLLDTNISRSTEPLVKGFLEMCSNPNYELKCKEELGYFTNNSIEAFLSRDNKNLFEQVRLISRFQYEYFQKMIPNAFNPVWELGLFSNIYSLKLCGAGGGGFILGFTADWKTTQEVLKDYELEVVVYL
jgi:mevalonate kinase